MYYNPQAPQRPVRSAYGQGPQMPSYPGSMYAQTTPQAPQITPPQRPNYSRPNQMAGPQMSFGPSGSGGGWQGIPRGGYDSQYPQTSMYGGTSIGGGRYIPRRKGGSQYGQYGLPPSFMQDIPVYRPPMYPTSMYSDFSGFSPGYNR